jgi:hypothetical protein
VADNLRGPISSQGCINSCRPSDLASEQPSHSDWPYKVTGAFKVFVSRMSRLEARTEAPAAKLHYSLIDSFILSRFVHPHLLSAAFP